MADSLAEGDTRGAPQRGCDRYFSPVIVLAWTSKDSSTG
jgi:hypothetical protein